jgi:hypothetical protein
MMIAIAIITPIQSATLGGMSHKPITVIAKQTKPIIQAALEIEGIPPPIGDSVSNFGKHAAIIL